MLKQIINQDPSEKGEAAQTAPLTPTPTSSAATDPAQSVGQGPPPSPAPKMSSSKNILSSDVEIKGTLKFSNDLIIDGRIEGEVNSEGDLTIGENATIEGNVNTRTVTVFGRVEGNITVSDRCELKQNAELIGDVSAAKLSIEEGASFMGSSQVGAAASSPSKSAAPASSSSSSSKASAGSSSSSSSGS